MDPAGGDSIRRTFDAAYRRLVSQLYGVCGDLAEAEDVVAEAFVIALSRRAAFERLDRPEAWLRTVAVNLARTRYRRRQLGERLKGRIEEREPVSVSTASDDRLTVVGALKALPREQREALALHYLADLSVAEVAEAVGAPVGTVKARLSRGRAALAATLIVEEDVTGDVSAPDYSRLAQRGQRRRTVRAAAVAGTVALAVVVILGFAQLLNDGRGDASPPPVAPSPTPTTVSGTGLGDGGACARFEGSTGTLDRQEPVYLTADCATKPLTLDLASNESAYALATSPDRTMVAYSVDAPSAPDRLEVLTLATDETRTIATSSDTLTGQAWSPDSTKLAVTRYEGGAPRLLIADLAEDTVEPISGGDPSGFSPSWSPDGTQVAFSRENDQSEIFSLANGRRRELEGAPLEEPIAWTGNGGALVALEYSAPDGKGSPPQFRIHRLDPDTGAVQMTSAWLPGRPQDAIGAGGSIVVAAVTNDVDSVTVVTTLDPNLDVVDRTPIKNIEISHLTLSSADGPRSHPGPPLPTQPPNDATQRGPRLPAAPKDLRRVAELFLNFARGESDSVPADTPIAFYVGGLLAKTIPTDALTDPNAWQACPAAGGYAAHICPVSALTQLARWPSRIAITSAAPSHPCANPTALPRTTDVYRSVTLTPKADLDCTNYFAVQLLVNDVQQVVAVNVVWAEP